MGGVLVFIKKSKKKNLNVHKDLYELIIIIIMDVSMYVYRKDRNIDAL